MTILEESIFVLKRNLSHLKVERIKGYEYKKLIGLIIGGLPKDY
jgi:hypothetical protein